VNGELLRGHLELSFKRARRSSAAVGHDHDHAGLLLEASNTIMASSVQGEGFFSSACAAASYQGR